MTWASLRDSNGNLWMLIAKVYSRSSAKIAERSWKTWSGLTSVSTQLLALVAETQGPTVARRECKRYRKSE